MKDQNENNLKLKDQNEKFIKILILSLRMRILQINLCSFRNMKCPLPFFFFRLIGQETSFINVLDTYYCREDLGMCMSWVNF